MSTDLETLLRDTFRSREHETVDSAERLLPGARRHAHRRRRLRVAGSAVGTMLAVASIIGAVVAPGRTGVPPRPPQSSVGTTSGPGPGQMLISSLGLEIAVPSGWDLNNYGCGMSDRPSVVRYRGVEPLCLTPEPPTKDLAIIASQPDGEYARMATRDITVAGVPAVLTEGRRPDGRYAGLLAIAARGVYLSVRTVREADQRAILGSARLVDTDHLGCPVRRPAATSQPGHRQTFVPTDPSSAAVCLYGTRPEASGVLLASNELTRDGIDTLVPAMNAAKPGLNPDAPASHCTDIAGHSEPDVLLRFVRRDGSVTVVSMSYSGCTRRGMDNGSAKAQLTDAILRSVMQGLHVGYGIWFPLDGQPAGS
jgi:hypothetical protein